MFSKKIGFYMVLATVIGGCSGMQFEPADKAPANDYEKAIYQQQKALDEQQRTILNAYHT